jgi:hypothetical protein
MNECDPLGGHNAHFTVYISPTAESVDTSHGFYRSKVFWLHVILKAFFNSSTDSNPSAITNVKLSQKGSPCNYQYRHTQLNATIIATNN